MSEDLLAQILDVLERIESKLDGLARIESAISDLQTEMSEMASSLQSVESDTSDAREALVDVKREVCGSGSSPGGFDLVVSALRELGSE